MDGSGESTWVQPKGAKLPLTDNVLAGKVAIYEGLGLRLTKVDEIDAQLSTGDSKVKCSQCNAVRNNRLLCYNCIAPMQNAVLPKPVELPIELAVVRHPSEKRSKSSALHAQILARKGLVNTMELPLPEELSFDPATTCVIFPCPESTPVELVPNLKQLKKVVVLDSTWSKAKGLNRLPALNGVPRVHLGTYKTFFWRYQRVPDTYLATIEAMYFFFVELFKAQHPGDQYDGRFDDLLAIYCAQFRKIVREQPNNQKNSEPEPKKPKLAEEQATNLEEEDEKQTGNEAK